MQVILFENVEKLGMQGDVVNVAKGYYRNYLGPRGIAVHATQTNLQRLKAKRNKLQAEAEKQVQEADAFGKRLSKTQVKFLRKSPDGKKLFGSVQDHEITEQLQEQGFSIERRQVTHEPIKDVGSHQVKVKLVGQVEAAVTVVIEAEITVPAEGSSDVEKALTKSETTQAKAEVEAIPKPKPEAATEEKS